MKTSANERTRNRAYRSQLRAVIKGIRSEKSKEKASEALTKVTALLDRAASRGLIHHRNAARNKSRLTLHVQKMA